jgi:predicted RNase H-like nuclease (RuvC/YqgF family)
MFMTSNRLSDSVQHDEAITRLQLQLQHVLHRCAELELQMLNSHDFALGQAAEIGGLRFRLTRQANLYEQQIADERVHISNHMAHIRRLEDALAETSSRAQALEVSRHEVNQLRSSMTWKIGRFVMWPIRFVKRFARRS